MAALDLIEQRQTIELRTLHPDVEKDQARHAFRNGGQRAVAVERHTRFVPLIGENASHDFANVRLVIHDQNIRRHMLLPCYFRRRPPRYRAAAL